MQLVQHEREQDHLLQLLSSEESKHKGDNNKLNSTEMCFIYNLLSCLFVWVFVCFQGKVYGWSKLTNFVQNK